MGAWAAERALGFGKVGASLGRVAYLRYGLRWVLNFWDVGVNWQATGGHRPSWLGWALAWLAGSTGAPLAQMPMLFFFIFGKQRQRTLL